MRPTLALGVITIVFFACPQRSMDEVVHVYSQAYNTAFARMGKLGLADTQARVAQMNDAGKPFQTELESLRKRQNAVNDLIVKAVENKKQAVADKKVAAVEEATKLLLEADTLGQQLLADITRFNEKLTAAGAPVKAPEPPRDPNARD